MAIYAIGDIQGCYNELRRLIDKVAFDPTPDTLWFTGDLVNRGPDSLSVLRFVKSLGSNAITVLGNHDLHLLACALNGQKTRRKDTFSDVLEAPDRDELIAWLTTLPLAYHDTQQDYLLVHAGLHPSWTIAHALALAREVETVLRDEPATILREMYGDTPTQWCKSLTPRARRRFVVNCFTRIRYCRKNGQLELKSKGEPGSQGSSLAPWYTLPTRRETTTRIVFGHWSTLRLSAADRERFRVYPLDTGAVWGGQLTALRLHDRRYFSVASNTHTPFD